MPRTEPSFVPVSVSLADLAGHDYVEAVCRARAALTGENRGELWDTATSAVDLFPTAFQRRLSSLLPRIGERLVDTGAATAPGASTAAFNSASHLHMAPLSGLGYYRLAEDGRLYFTTKAEHYHVPLGHSFPGYALVERAKALGIPNATHNNTRGHVTRLLEEALIRSASVPDTLTPHPCSPTRVLNLQTGSLAVEAAFKMCLARFYASQEGLAPPKYAGRTPVFVVIADDDGKPYGNYHGTTAFVQSLRGLWPGLSARMEELGIMRVCPVRPNHPEDLDAAFEEFERPPFKIAAFFHEIVMMNYGARVLTREFLRRAYDLCSQHDVPTVCDEIQSCLWAPGLFLFREWGLAPSFAVVGKGFPGGEYAASRVLFTEAMDNLSQFGALVTNGQEELASLAYLITMRWALANEEPIRRLGEYYADRLHDLAATHPSHIAGVEGHLHMSALRFRDMGSAKAFAVDLNRRGFDISVQAYKADCPPIVLTKVPLIAGADALDTVIRRMDDAAGALS